MCSDGSCPADVFKLSAMPVWDDGERAALVALLRARPDGMSWSRIAADVAAVGSAQQIWDQRTAALLFDDDDRETALEAARNDVALWRKARFRFLTFLDEDYPARLRDVHQMPPVLFLLGRHVEYEHGVSVVGSRAGSRAGLDFSSEVSARLARHGITVLSGLAAGVDTAAHTAALAAGGRTVAVVGTGIEKSYPATNRSLQERIADEGLVLSQFWPQAPPTKHSFLMRNAIMSAYGYATIVVEAGEQSGARSQARMAVEHGRPVILTESVMQATAWGRALRGQPGVSVAKTPDEAVTLVHEVVGRERCVDQLLAMASR